MTRSPMVPRALGDLYATPVPLRYLDSIEPEIRAARESVALTPAPHVSIFRLSGDGAFDLLDRVCCGDIKIRDGQLLHTLMLRDDGTPLADTLVGLDDESWLVLAEGASEEALFAWLESHQPAAPVEIERLSREWGALFAHGPFAWELLSVAYGPEVIGFPYLSFFRPDARRVCFRAGSTGEFGYLVAAPRDELAALDAQLEAAGQSLDLGRVGLEAVWHCSVENWTFNIHRYHASAHRALGLTPIELQMQARLSPVKDYVGRSAIEQRRAEGPRARIVGALCNDPLAPGDPVHLDALRIGTILDAVRSHSLGLWVATALVDHPYSHSGITRYRAGPAPDAPSLRTVSPPFVANRSLFINPQRHSYLTRDEIQFPPSTGLLR